MSGSTINFPTNPTVGQTYTFNNTTWVWNGTVWTNATTGATFLPLTGGTMNIPGTIAAATLEQPIVNQGTQNQPTIIGFTDGSSAPAGAVGQVVTNSNTSTSMPSGQVWNIASLTVPAGSWAIWGSLTAPGASNASALVSVVSVGLSTASNAMGNYQQLGGPNAAGNGYATWVGPVFVNLAAATNYFLNALATFTGQSAITQTGILWAQRLR